jgi:hypothetical protein
MLPMLAAKTNSHTLWVIEAVTTAKFYKREPVHSVAAPSLVHDRADVQISNFLVSHSYIAMFAELLVTASADPQYFEAQFSSAQ